jgi:hypothetical protein
VKTTTCTAGSLSGERGASFAQKPGDPGHCSIPVGRIGDLAHEATSDDHSVGHLTELFGLFRRRDSKSDGHRHGGVSLQIADERAQRFTDIPPALPGGPDDRDGVDESFGLLANLRQASGTITPAALAARALSANWAGPRARIMFA